MDKKISNIFYYNYGIFIIMTIVEELFKHFEYVGIIIRAAERD